VNSGDSLINQFERFLLQIKDNIDQRQKLLRKNRIVSREILQYIDLILTGINDRIRYTSSINSYSTMDSELESFKIIQNINFEYKKQLESKKLTRPPKSFFSNFGIEVTYLILLLIEKKGIKTPKSLTRIYPSINQKNKNSLYFRKDFRLYTYDVEAGIQYPISENILLNMFINPKKLQLTQKDLSQNDDPRNSILQQYKNGLHVKLKTTTVLDVLNFDCCEKLDIIRVENGYLKLGNQGFELINQMNSLISLLSAPVIEKSFEEFENFTNQYINRILERKETVPIDTWIDNRLLLLGLYEEERLLSQDFDIDLAIKQNELLKHRDTLIAVTGPLGSGKSNLLFQLVFKLFKDDRLPIILNLSNIDSLNSERYEKMFNHEKMIYEIDCLRYLIDISFDFYPFPNEETKQRILNSIIRQIAKKDQEDQIVVLIDGYDEYHGSSDLEKMLIDVISKMSNKFRTLIFGRNMSINHFEKLQGYKSKHLDLTIFTLSLFSNQQIFDFYGKIKNLHSTDFNISISELDLKDILEARQIAQIHNPFILNNLLKLDKKVLDKSILQSKEFDSYMINEIIINSVIDRYILSNKFGVDYSLMDITGEIEISRIDRNRTRSIESAIIPVNELKQIIRSIYLLLAIKIYSGIEKIFITNTINRSNYAQKLIVSSNDLYLKISNLNLASLRASLVNILSLVESLVSLDREELKIVVDLILFNLLDGNGMGKYDPVRQRFDFSSNRLAEHLILFFIRESQSTRLEYYKLLDDLIKYIWFGPEIGSGNLDLLLFQIFAKEKMMHSIDSSELTVEDNISLRLIKIKEIYQRELKKLAENNPKYEDRLIEKYNGNIWSNGFKRSNIESIHRVDKENKPCNLYKEYFFDNLINDDTFNAIKNNLDFYEYIEFVKILHTSGEARKNYLDYYEHLLNYVTNFPLRFHILFRRIVDTNWNQGQSHQIDISYFKEILDTISFDWLKTKNGKKQLQFYINEGRSGRISYLNSQYMHKGTGSNKVRVNFHSSFRSIAEALKRDQKISYRHVRDELSRIIEIERIIGENSHDIDNTIQLANYELQLHLIDKSHPVLIKTIFYETFLKLFEILRQTPFNRSITLSNTILILINSIGHKYLENIIMDSRFHVIRELVTQYILVFNDILIDLGNTNNSNNKAHSISNIKSINTQIHFITQLITFQFLYSTQKLKKFDYTFEDYEFDKSIQSISSLTENYVINNSEKIKNNMRFPLVLANLIFFSEQHLNEVYRFILINNLYNRSGVKLLESFQELTNEAMSSKIFHINLILKKLYKLGHAILPSNELLTKINRDRVIINKFFEVCIESKNQFIVDLRTFGRYLQILLKAVLNDIFKQSVYHDLDNILFMLSVYLNYYSNKENTEIYDFNDFNYNDNFDAYKWLISLSNHQIFTDPRIIRGIYRDQLFEINTEYIEIYNNASKVQINLTSKHLQKITSAIVSYISFESIQLYFKFIRGEKILSDDFVTLQYYLWFKLYFEDKSDVIDITGLIHSSISHYRKQYNDFYNTEPVECLFENSDRIFEIYILNIFDFSFN
jgi:hypothetical protein